MCRRPGTVNTRKCTSASPPSPDDMQGRLHQTSVSPQLQRQGSPDRRERCRRGAGSAPTSQQPCNRPSTCLYAIYQICLLKDPHIHIGSPHPPKRQFQTAVLSVPDILGPKTYWRPSYLPTFYSLFRTPVHPLPTDLYVFCPTARPSSVQLVPKQALLIHSPPLSLAHLPVYFQSRPTIFSLFPSLSTFCHFSI